MGDIQSDSLTVAKSTKRIVLLLATSNNWTIKTTDIKSAFLQGGSLERTVFIKPPKELQGYRGGSALALKCGGLTNR